MTDINRRNTPKITKLSSKKKRTASSRQWLLRQLNDPYVEKAKKEGYRSRAAYKLLDIQKKVRLLKANQRVLDLGAAPGGWSQVAFQIVGKKGFVLGVDLLDIEPLEGVAFLKGDFLDPSIQTQILQHFGDEKVHVVISDMAAKACGIPEVDHTRLMDLLENAYVYALDILMPGGHFVAKVLRGGTEHLLLKKLKQSFTKVIHFKPPSSRSESSELYVMAMGFRGSCNV